MLEKVIEKLEGLLIEDDACFWDCENGYNWVLLAEAHEENASKEVEDAAFQVMEVWKREHPEPAQERLTWSGK